MPTGCDLDRVPRARDHRLPARGPAAASRRSSPQAQECLEKVAARTGRTRGGRRLPRRRTATSTTPPRSAPTARCRASTASTSCRTTRCSTSSATSPPSTVDGPLFVDRRRARRRSRSARTRGARPGRSARRPRAAPSSSSTSTRSPYYAGRLRERETMLATRAGRRVGAGRLRQPRRRPGRARLRRRRRWCSTRTGELVARAGQFVEDLLVVDLDVRPGFRKRLLDPRGRLSCAAAARGHGHRGPHRRARVRRRGSSPLLAARAGGLRGARARHARLRRARTASPTCSSACRAASTRRSSRPSPPTRSGPSTCTACSCRRATRARAASPTPTLLADEPRHRHA